MQTGHLQVRTSASTPGRVCSPMWHACWNLPPVLIACCSRIQNCLVLSPGCITNSPIYLHTSISDRSEALLLAPDACIPVRSPSCLRQDARKDEVGVTCFAGPACKWGRRRTCQQELCFSQPVSSSASPRRLPHHTSKRAPSPSAPSPPVSQPGPGTATSPLAGSVAPRVSRREEVVSLARGRLDGRRAVEPRFSDSLVLVAPVTPRVAAPDPVCEGAVGLISPPGRGEQDKSLPSPYVLTGVLSPHSYRQPKNPGGPLHPQAGAFRISPFEQYGRFSRGSLAGAVAAATTPVPLAFPGQTRHHSRPR